MSELALVIAALFAYGVFRGTSTCATICTPALLPYVASSGMGPARALKMGIMFNLPRLVMLVIFGAIVGALSSSVFSESGLKLVLTVTHDMAYMAIGILLIFLGVHILRKGGSERTPGSRHRKRRGRPNLFPRWIRGERRFVTTWGSLLSVACLMEVGLLEGLAMSTLLGASESNVVIAAMLGAGAMAAFGIGAAVPVITLVVLTSKYADMERPSHTRFFTEIVPWLMVLVGIFLIGTSALRLSL